MAGKTYIAWIHVEVDGEEAGEPAKLFETQNFVEMALFLSGLKFVPGYSLDIEEEVREMEKRTSVRHTNINVEISKQKPWWEYQGFPIYSSKS